MSRGPGFHMATRIALFAALAISIGGRAVAQPDSGQDITKKIAFNQVLGAQLPRDAAFTDDHGKPIKLGDLFGEKPILLMPVFYTCKSSCLLVRDGVIKSLNAQKSLKVGRDFDVVAISMHPKETPDLAAAKKSQWVADYKYDDTADAWHLLVGSKDQVDRVMDAIGFKYYYDEAKDTVAHAAGIVLVTVDGRASEYLLGVNYPQKRVFDGLVRAGRNEIGIPTEQILFGCLMYDPATGRYRVVVERTLQVVGTLFAIVVALVVTKLAISNRRTPLAKGDLVPKDMEPGRNG